MVKPEGTRDWVKKLQDLGTSVGYTEYPGVQHNSWENAYKDAAIFDWFAKFKRVRFPDRVRFATTRYKYDGAYWVRIDRMTPGSPATVEAKFVGPNRIEIAASGLEGADPAPGRAPRILGEAPARSDDRRADDRGAGRGGRSRPIDPGR